MEEAEAAPVSGGGDELVMAMAVMVAMTVAVVVATARAGVVTVVIAAAGPGWGWAGACVVCVWLGRGVGRWAIAWEWACVRACVRAWQAAQRARGRVHCAVRESMDQAGRGRGGRVNTLRGEWPSHALLGGPVYTGFLIINSFSQQSIKLILN